MKNIKLGQINNENPPDYLSGGFFAQTNKNFFDMSSISLSVAVVSFIIGLLVKRFLGIDI